MNASGRTTRRFTAQGSHIAGCKAGIAPWTNARLPMQSSLRPLPTKAPAGQVRRFVSRDRDVAEGVVRVRGGGRLFLGDSERADVGADRRLGATPSIMSKRSSFCNALVRLAPRALGCCNRRRGAVCQRRLTGCCHSSRALDSLLLRRHCRSGEQPAQVAGSVRFHPEQGRRPLVWFGRLPRHQAIKPAGPVVNAFRALRDSSCSDRDARCVNGAGPRRGSGLGSRFPR